MSVADVARAVAVLCVVICVAGCGEKPASSVHGKVTFDGEPVTNGSIVFLPVVAGGSKGSAAIENGEYKIPAQDKLQPGKYRVEISWRKPTGKQVASADPGIMIDETREAIPTKFNADSTLTAEIGSGDAEKDFALTSK